MERKYQPHNVLGSGLRVTSRLQLFDSLGIFIEGEVCLKTVREWIKSNPILIINGTRRDGLQIGPNTYSTISLSPTAYNFLREALKEKHPEILVQQAKRKQARMNKDQPKILTKLDGTGKVIFTKKIRKVKN